MIFATIAPDGKSGMLKLDLDAHEALLRAESDRITHRAGAPD
jgi:hypothetical protein